MQVREIMTREVATASPGTSLKNIAAMMRDEDTGAIPVVEDGELIGIITDRDIVVRCIAEGKKPAEVRAEDIISEQLETVEPTEDVQNASRLMAQKQIRRLPVVENGRLVGMVSLGDIAVKDSDRIAGGALESVSRGVKENREAADRPRSERQSPKTQDRAASLRKRATLRQEQERSGARMVTGGTGAPQGISNHGIEEERERQEKVVPISNQGKTTRKRKAS